MPFRNSDWYDFWNTDWRETGAVYGIFTHGGVLLYIGQTGNLKQRMEDHRCNRGHCMHRGGPKWVVVEVIQDESLRLARERQLIKELDPPCNKV